MAKPTADTDKELIQQLRNLKAEMVERINELTNREYQVTISVYETSGTFNIEINKDIKFEETI